MKTERIAVLSGVRSPLIKAGTALSDFQADKLGIIAVKEAIHKADLKVGEVDELIMGNVIQPVHAANVARVIAVDAGLDQRTIAVKNVVLFELVPTHINDGFYSFNPP